MGRERLTGVGGESFLLLLLSNTQNWKIRSLLCCRLRLDPGRTENKQLLLGKSISFFVFSWTEKWGINVLTKSKPNLNCHINYKLYQSGILSPSSGWILYCSNGNCTAARARFTWCFWKGHVPPSSCHFKGTGMQSLNKTEPKTLKCCIQM